jgi:hypothetical protein
VIGILSALLLTAPSPASAQCAREWIADDSAALRAVVVLTGETDPAVAEAIAALGANAVASLNPPDAAAGATAAAAGLVYIARMHTRDVLELPFDPAAVERLRAIPGLAGIEYIDDTVEEGYTSPATQARAYQILEVLFPDLLALYATRLDPVETDPFYLDHYYRPEFTDLVTPYFYPVGTTVLGPQQEDDAWEARLRCLLEPLAARTPTRERVLPLLQAFEQVGYPIRDGLVRRQLDVYAEFWPGNRNAAYFWWGGGTSEPLVGMSERPVVKRGVAESLGGVPSRPVPCAAAPRASRER